MLLFLLGNEVRTEYNKLDRVAAIGQEMIGIPLYGQRPKRRQGRGAFALAVGDREIIDDSCWVR